jgi:NAD(P)-dependent dehydrogenase (short-subunit alcohol dehydrogenase family)
VVLHGKTGPAPVDPPGAPFLEINLLDPDAPARLVAAAFAADPGLDQLVCNAGRVLRRAVFWT